MTESSDQTNPGRTVVTQMSAVYPELAGKVAVVTGAAQGMGATFAEGLATRGVHVVGADINEEQMLATAARINTDLESNALADKPGRVVGGRVDVTKPDEHELLAQLALKEFGRVDFWINNAGIFPFALAEEITPEQIGATLSVNVEGVLYGAQAAARHLGPGGAIVNMSSVSALRVRKEGGRILHVESCRCAPHGVSRSGVRRQGYSGQLHCTRLHRHGDDEVGPGRSDRARERTRRGTAASSGLARRGLRPAAVPALGQRALRHRAQHCGGRWFAACLSPRHIPASFSLPAVLPGWERITRALSPRAVRMSALPMFRIHPAWSTTSSPQADRHPLIFSTSPMPRPGTGLSTKFAPPVGGTRRTGQQCRYLASARIHGHPPERHLGADHEDQPLRPVLRYEGGGAADAREWWRIDRQHLVHRRSDRILLSGLLVEQVGSDRSVEVGRRQLRAVGGIRVNSVHPGLVGTALLGGANDFVAASLKSVPFGRMGTLDEITEAVLFLLSNSSTYTTGTELTVDGGLVSNGLYHRIIAETGELS